MSARVSAVRVLLITSALAIGAAQPAAVRAPGRVTAERIAAADAEPENWLAHGRTWSEQRYSPLSQIDETNVHELAPAWVVPTGTLRGLEATPLVVDGVMVTTLTWSVVVALDAASGRELWRYDPQVPKAWGRFACCDAVNRGVAWWNGRVYVGTLDGRLVALDASSGARVWEVRTTDPSKPYTITGAPRVAEGLVFIGNGGAEFGVRGYVSAYDADTGALVWRFYTVPASKEGPHERPELETAAATWSENSTWESGLGGTVWDSMAYDAELGLLYVGVGNASPYDRTIRSPGGGDNLFLASILALRARSGELVWHYQTTPAENWDYTATQHMILADLEIDGKPRKVLMQAPKNGFFYLLDRVTGELLSAEKYVYTSWASHVDLASGRPVETGRGQWSEAGAMVAPGVSGGHNWHPMAFHPGTGLVYVPSQDMPYPYHPEPGHVHVPGAYNTAEDFAALSREVEGLDRAFRICSPTHLLAWDPVAGREVWRVSHESEAGGGVLATAGNLVFKSSGDGEIAAFRATDGERLWTATTGVGVIAPPISYAVGGVQYVAVMVGTGGSAGQGFAFMRYENRGAIVAFRLGGTATLPVPVPLEPGTVDAPPATATAETVERGRALYARHCLRCHGTNAVSRGLHPDLRFSARAVHDQWSDIVLSGTRADRGMASFADLLSSDDAQAIHAYVIARAHEPVSTLTRAAEWITGKGACIPVSWIVD